jgi:hypothetical protein
MKKMKIFLLICLFVLSFNGLLLPMDNYSGDLLIPEVVGDIVLVRPLGAFHIALGAVAYVISLPVTIPLRKTEGAKEFLITYPVNYFIKRPIGEL